MQLWLDTLDREVICQANEMKIFTGITTNPKLIAASKQSLDKTLEELLHIQAGYIAIQVTETSKRGMIDQGKAIGEYDDRCIVKVPATVEGIKAIAALSGIGLRTMATAVFDPLQMLYAAKAGADYIAFYYNKIVEAKIDINQMLEEMTEIRDTYHFDTELLAASLRNQEQINTCIYNHVGAITINDQLFYDLFKDNPFTEQECDSFQLAWKEAKPSKLLRSP